MKKGFDTQIAIETFTHRKVMSLMKELERKEKQLTVLNKSSDKVKIYEVEDQIEGLEEAIFFLNRKEA